MAFDPVSFAAGKKAGSGGDPPVLVPLTATENGEYCPSDYGADGFDQVSVDVPPPALPTLTDPAGAGDIRYGKDALDGNGDRVVGTMLTYSAKQWQSASLADFPAGQVLSDLPQGVSNLFGGISCTTTLGGSPRLINMGVMAIRTNGSLVLSAGGSDGSMAFAILLTGSMTGLSCLQFYIASGGSLVDMTAQADQVISNLSLLLYYFAR